MSNNISTNFSGFDNLQDTTALKTKILSLTLPINTNLGTGGPFYFGASLERGSIVTNIIPSLIPVADAPGNMTVSYVTNTAVNPNEFTILGTITPRDPAVGVPTFAAEPANLNVAIAGDYAIRVTFANANALTAARTYRFAIIYKKGH